MVILGFLLINFLSIEATANPEVINFLEDIHKVGQFKSVLVVQNQKPFSKDFIKDIAISLEIPCILSTDTNSFAIKNEFNVKILTIVQLNSISETDVLNRMANNLKRMRSCKTIFLLNYSSKDEDVLKFLFKFSWKNRMLNVLAVFLDFSNTTTFYRYTMFPEFAIEENLWIKGLSIDEYFPNRMRDLRGYELPLIFGGSEPKMIFSKDKNGRPLIRGYAGHFFMALAKTYNANISNPQIDRVSSAQHLKAYIRNGTFDISAATTHAEIPMDWFTYPYDNLDWCLVVPVEPSIPINEVFMIVFQWDTLLTTIAIIIMLSVLLETAIKFTGRETSIINYFFNDSCLRGALGQSFLEISNASYNIKFIYLLICLIGIILVTSYNAFLQTYITSPPSEKPIETFDDLLASNLKVYFLRSEYDSLMESSSQFQKYLKIFFFEKDFKNYTIFRDRFDPHYAYGVNSVRWIIIQELQKIFSRPLFRMTKDSCFFKGIPMGFPINENSIFLDVLNFLMLEVKAAGLLEYWERRSFNELVEIGKLKLVDLTSKPEFVPLKVQDLQLIWIGMCVACVLGVLLFVGEICVFKWKTRKSG